MKNRKTHKCKILFYDNIYILFFIVDHLISSRKNIRFVAVPCIKYNRDMDHAVESCRYPHVCAKHIICDELCDVNTCSKNHNLVTDQSREILADLGFIADGNYDSLLESYSQKCKEKLTAIPHVTVTGPCCYYNYKGCVLGELHCPFTHICKDWFHGSCLNENCEWSHNILNKQTKRLLQIFKIDTINQMTSFLPITGKNIHIRNSCHYQIPQYPELNSSGETGCFLWEQVHQLY